MAARDSRDNGTRCFQRALRGLNSRIMIALRACDRSADCSHARNAIMILLFNPRSARWKHRVPLSLLSLAAMLEGRYDYEIVDGNIETNAEAKLASTIRNKGI